MRVLDDRGVWAKDAPDREFLGYLPLIRRAATGRPQRGHEGCVLGAPSIGKRNVALHAAAIEEARAMLEVEGRSARWIARDALELERGTTRARLPDRAR